MIKGKATKRQLQAFESKDKLFTAAVKLFERHGYDSVTIEDICSEAGVSKGLFYNYFSSKEEIFIPVFTQVEDVYRQVRASFLPTETSTERLLTCVEKVLRYILDSELRTEALRIVYSNTLKQPNGFLMKPDRELFSIIAEIIEYGQQRGEIRTDVSVEAIRRLITTHLFGCYFVWIADAEFDIRRELQRHMLMLMEGISPASQKPAHATGQ